MGGGASKQKSESESTAKTAAQTATLADALAIYGPELGRNENVYQGDRVAGFTGLQSQAVSGAGNFADYFSDRQTVGTPLNVETGQAIERGLSGELGATKLGQEQVDTYFQDVIADPRKKQFTEELSPFIDESFAGPGFFGAARSNAQVKAARDLEGDLATQYADLSFDVLQANQALDEADAARTQAAVGQGLAFGQQPAQETMNNLAIAAKQVEGLEDIFGFGEAQQTQEQAELSDTVARFMEENAITDPENMGIIMGLLGLNFSTSRGESRGSSFNISS